MILWLKRFFWLRKMRKAAGRGWLKTVMHDVALQRAVRRRLRGK